MTLPDPAGPARWCRWPRQASHVRDVVTDEHGSASVLVALWAVVLTMLAAGAIVLTTVLAGRESVAAAADLAALAGAAATVDQPSGVCYRARSIAAANGATLDGCDVAGTDVWVTVRAPAPASVRWLFAGRAPSLRARAHAQLTAELP